MFFLESILTLFDAIIFKLNSGQIIAPSTKPLTSKYAELSLLEVQAANMAEAIAAKECGFVF